METTRATAGNAERASLGRTGGNKTAVKRRVASDTDERWRQKGMYCDEMAAAGGRATEAAVTTHTAQYSLFWRSSASHQLIIRVEILLDTSAYITVQCIRKA